MDWINPTTVTVAGFAIVGTMIKLGIWIGRMDKFKSSVEGTMQRIEQTISTIQGDIKRILRALPPCTIETESPIRLNELGRRVSSELQAKKLLGRLDVDAPE